jgi:hypothetical protein
MDRLARRIVLRRRAKRAGRVWSFPALSLVPIGIKKQPEALIEASFLNSHAEKYRQKYRHL